MIKRILGAFLVLALCLQSSAAGQSRQRALSAEAFALPPFWWHLPYAIDGPRPAPLMAFAMRRDAWRRLKLSLSGAAPQSAPRPPSRWKSQIAMAIMVVAFYGAFHPGVVFDAALAIERRVKHLLNPHSAVAPNRLGNPPSPLGELGVALTKEQKIKELNTQNAIALNTRGFARQEKGDWTGALANYREAVKRDPHYAAAWNNLGFAQKATGDLKGALTSFRTAIGLNPKHAIAYAHLVRTLRALGDRPGALAAVHQGLTDNPDDPDLKDLQTQLQAHPLKPKASLPPSPQEKTPNERVLAAA